MNVYRYSIDHFLRIYQYSTDMLLIVTIECMYIYIYLDLSSTWIKTGEITDRLLLNTFVEHLEGLNIYYIGGSKHIL